jgi:hypothetical protein
VFSTYIPWVAWRGLCGTNNVLAHVSLRASTSGLVRPASCKRSAWIDLGPVGGEGSLSLQPPDGLGPHKSILTISSQSRPCACDKLRPAGACAHLNNSMQGRTVDLDPAMIAAFADSDADGDAPEAYWKADPLYHQDILLLTKEELRGLMHSDQLYFKAALSELNESELAFMTKLFANGTPQSRSTGR